MKQSSDTYIVIGIAVYNFIVKVLSLSSNTTDNTRMKFYIVEFQ
jgi:hypothetical protein